MFEIINNIVSEITNIRNKFSFAHPFANIVQQTPSFQDNHFDDSDSHESNKIVEEEEEEEEEEDDDEDDGDEEEDEDEEEEDDDDDDAESEKIIESDDEDRDLGKSIKIVNVNIESNTIDLTEINDLEIDELGESDDEINININATALDSEPIFVNKVDEFVTTVHDKKESIVDSKEIYKNMNTQNLKALVITKGLSSNPSKLKKNELVQLLENSE
jgi:hypothetical protein